MAVTDVLTKAEEYGKSVTAFTNAVQTAALSRESTIRDLGIDITNARGKTITPEEAARALGPGKPQVLRGAARTSFGEGAMPTIAKESAATTGANVTALSERGIGATSGLTKQARIIGTDIANVTRQQTVSDALKAIADANAGVVSANQNKNLALAALRTAQGRKFKGGG